MYIDVVGKLHNQRFREEIKEVKGIIGKLMSRAGLLTIHRLKNKVKEGTLHENRYLGKNWS